MAKRKSKTEGKKGIGLGDIAFKIVHEVAQAFFENLREKSFAAFPILMKSLVHKLIKRYMYMLILGFVAILLIGMGVAEFLVMQQVPRYLAYIGAGVIFALIAAWQFRKD